MTTEKTSKLSPMALVAIGYGALALTLPMQEAILRGYVAPGSLFSNLAAAIIFSVVFLAPILAVFQSVWLLAHRKQKMQSIAAILISSPILFLLLSGVRRSLS